MSNLTVNQENTSHYVFINMANMPEVELVEQELNKCISNLISPMKEMCFHVFSSGGKRIRPLLLFYCCKCFASYNSQMLQAATAAELIHLASLVHDDIIDNSDLRHNNITLNSKHGSHTSVLVGDYLFAKAFEILNNNHIFDGMNFFVQAIEDMCEGEILQAAEIDFPTLSPENYFVRIKKKTASLISACCKTGAAISSSNRTYIDCMAQYGLNLGYAFQIVDDMLDFNGDNIKLGKPIFSDIKQGNLTLPIILLSQHYGYSEYINEIKKGKTVNKEILSIIIDGLHNTDALKNSYDKASEFCEAAKACLKDIPDNPYRQFLLTLPDTILARCN